jgi:hypothetical protein
MFHLFSIHYETNGIKVYAMGRACNTYGKDKKLEKNVQLQCLTERELFEKIYLPRKIILKWILNCV